MLAVMRQNDTISWGEIVNRIFTKKEIVKVEGTKNENLVILSEQEYEQLEKARRNQEYLAEIDKAIAQREAGTMQEHELIEV